MSESMIFNSITALQKQEMKSSNGQQTSGNAALFASMLTSALSPAKQSEDTTAGAGLMGSSTGSNMLSMLMSGGTEGLSSILGDANKIESVLLLMCMLMGANQNSSAASWMAKASTAVASLPEAEIETVRKNVMDSDNDPLILDKVNQDVFHRTEGAAIPSEAWKPVNPALVNDSTNRSASAYRAVIDQFSVETNNRYEVNKNGKQDTYCNIFVWDVTRSMSAEIPHYIDPVTQEPKYNYPDVKGAKQLNANGICDWLRKLSSQYGWVQVTAEQAQNMANEGKPAVAVKRNNDGGHGHVMVVSPSKDGLYDPKRGVMIAQAGSTLSNYGPLRNLKQVLFYAHN